MRHFGSGFLVSSLSAAVLLFGASAHAQERASIVGVGAGLLGRGDARRHRRGRQPGADRAQCARPITDGRGRYAIIDLRPGTYTVTFTLQGFNKVMREGIVLEGAFAAQVNASLVGRHGRRNGHRYRRVAGRRRRRARRTRRCSIARCSTCCPPRGRCRAARRWCRASASTARDSSARCRCTDRAAADQHIFFDGMNIGQNLTGTGSQANGVGVNELAQTELVYDAGSQSAENALGGVRMDSIPKEGGNTFSGVWRTFGSKGALQDDNITDELRPFISGGTQARLQLRHERRARRADSEEQAVVPGRAARVADQQSDSAARRRTSPQGGTSESGGSGRAARDGAADLAGVAAQQDRVRVLQVAGRHAALRRRLHARPAATPSRAFRRKRRTGCRRRCSTPRRPKWTSPITSRLLLESRAVARGADLQVQLPAGERPVRHPASQSHDRACGRWRRAPRRRTTSTRSGTRSPTSSYVTGSHNFKAGVNQQWGWSTREGGAARRHVGADLSTNANGVPTPNSVTAAQHAVHPAGESSTRTSDCLRRTSGRSTG